MTYYCRRVLVMKCAIFHLLFTIVKSINAFKPYVLCPLNQEQWNNRSRKLTCNVIQGKHYHCLKNSEDDFFIELCLEVRALPFEGGCPVLGYDGGEPTIKQKPCLGRRTGCPNPKLKSVLLSNELYKYPACISQESEETSAYKFVTGKDHTTESTENWRRVSPVTNDADKTFQNKVPRRVIQASTNAYIGGAVAGFIFAVLVFLIIFECCRMSKIEKAIRLIPKLEDVTASNANIYDEIRDNILLQEVETQVDHDFSDPEETTSEQVDQDGFGQPLSSLSEIAVQSSIRSFPPDC